MPPTPKRTRPTPEQVKAYADMSPSEQVAHDILTEYGDLAPSVRHIMQADLSDAQRHRAISSFRDALATRGDPHRDPRYAIAHCGADDRA